MKVLVIGIGCGHPDQLTAEAVEALRSVDYVIAADKVRADDGPDPLLAARAEICRRHGVELAAVPDPARDRDDPGDYPGAVRDWHAARAMAYAEVLRARRGTAAFLVWGDPAFYDSTIRVVQQVAREHTDLRVEYDVLPGISAPQVLAARHRIVLHEVGRPVLFTTGRRLLDEVAASHDNIVVMLDGRLTCAELSDPGGWHIWWGANLGTADERLVTGCLADVIPQIRTARTAVGVGAGWVMDTYLVRRIHADIRRGNDRVG